MNVYYRIVWGCAGALIVAACGVEEAAKSSPERPEMSATSVERIVEPKVTASPGSLGMKESFYSSAKPLTRWWWFASMMKEEDIEHQLDWFKEQNFGGVEVAWVYPRNIPRYKRYYPQFTDAQRKQYTPRQEWLSPKWSAIVAHAKGYADQIGLGMDFTFGSAWPFGDSLVPDDDASQVFGKPDFRQLNLIPWEFPKQGNVIDHLEKGAFSRYAKRMGAALKPALAGNRSGIFVDSFEVETKRIWTDNFGAIFRRRNGYDIEPYMDQIYAKKNTGPRYDYMKLVSDMVLENFYKPFNRVAHELGAFSRGQCAGAPTDIISAYAAVDVPETEALLYEPGYARIVASAAALGGKRDVTCETFTCLYGWPREFIKQEQTADLKLVADAVFANGVNHVIWHGAPFNGKGPEVNEFYASVHVGRTGGLAKDIAPFNAYMEKVQSVLKQGRAYSDVAVYLPLEDAWIAGEYPKKLQMPWSWGAYELRYVKFAEEIVGYHPLWINHRFLRQATVKDGSLLVGASRFASLYIDVEHMDDAALSTVLDLAKQGLRICLKRNPKQPGRNQSDGFLSKLEELNGLKNVSADWSKVSNSSPLIQGENLPDYFARVVENEVYIFFAHPKAQNLHLPLTYGQSFIKQKLVRRIKLTMGGKITELDLVFEPYQSLLLKASPTGDPVFVDITFNPKVPSVKPPKAPKK